MGQVEITCRWPVGLTPNTGRRTGESTRTGLEVQDREAGRLAALAVLSALDSAGKGFVLPDGPLLLEIVFCPPTSHDYDSDGCVARVKAQRDGIADGLGVDDKRFWPLVAKQGSPQEGGRVIFRVWWGVVVTIGEPARRADEPP